MTCIICMIFSPVCSELISNKYKNFQSNLTPIVIKGNYSYEYKSTTNWTTSYLYLYDYMPVSQSVIKLFFVLINF